MTTASLRLRHAFAAAAFLSPALLLSQSVPSGPAIQLAPLRVTADLWESPPERVPASVSLYEAGALRGGIRHFGDLVDQIPNLTWTGGTSRPRHLQIRGVGENSQYEGETPDSAVRFLVDDLDFTGLGGAASTFDVEQIEVLRGPQAGAFGPNAAGGLVRVVTAAPTPLWTGLLEATAEGTGCGRRVSPRAARCSAADGPPCWAGSRCTAMSARVSGATSRWAATPTRAMNAPRGCGWRGGDRRLALGDGPAALRPAQRLRRVRPR